MISGQNGTALICALMITALLGMLGGALVVLAATETLISANHRDGLEASYAADAGIERAIGDLRTLPAWQTVPGTAAGTATPDFRDGASAPALSDGTILDLARLTLERQADSNAVYPAGPDRPIWRLFAHAPLSWLLPGQHWPEASSGRRHISCSGLRMMWTMAMEIRCAIRTACWSSALRPSGCAACAGVSRPRSRARTAEVRSRRRPDEQRCE